MGFTSRVTILITHIRGPITPLITTHEPPSTASNLSQPWFAVKRSFYAELRREAKSKKALLEGGLGGEP